MGEPILDPGPLPATVEPEPVEQVLLVAPGREVGVTANVAHTGLTGLTVRLDAAAATVPLNTIQVGELCRLLAASIPGGSSLVGLVRRVLIDHQVHVDHFRRRGGYCWWCSCLTDGTEVHPDGETARAAGASHQAVQVAAALGLAAYLELEETRS